MGYAERENRAIRGTAMRIMEQGLECTMKVVWKEGIPDDYLDVKRWLPTPSNLSVILMTGNRSTMRMIPWSSIRYIDIEELPTSPDA